jgi:quercetin dioxygenase-like cupin family protein
MTGGEPAAAAGSFDALPSEEPFDGVTRRALTTARMTINSYAFEPGATFPLHSHSQEQWTLVEQGSIEMTVAGRAARMGVGEWSLVDPGVEHGITAGEEGARVLAIIAPPRGSADEYELADAPGRGR